MNALPPEVGGLPHSASTHPPTLMLHSLRPLARWVVRRRFPVRIHHGERVPADGPVIFAANHVGVADGPLLAIFAPRPVHALTKEEMFDGRLRRLLLASGQIRLDRFHSDPAAVKSCLRVLRGGGAIGIFPEGSRGAGEFQRFHRGAAYLALVSGAPVVPVIQFGTRRPGGTSNSLPPRGLPVDIVFGEPYRIQPAPWPRTKEQVGEVSLLLRDQLRTQLARARELTGRTLPGPLPAHDVDPDPATGVTSKENHE